MAPARLGEHRRVQVDADDLETTTGELGGHPSRAAAGVEHAAGSERSDEVGFAVHGVAAAGQLVEASLVGGSVPGVASGGHGSSLACGRVRRRQYCAVAGLPAGGRPPGGMPRPEASRNPPSVPDRPPLSTLLDAEVLAEIVEDGAVPFLILDPRGVVRWAGRSIERVYGVAAAVLVGRRLGEFVADSEVPVALEALAELAAPGAGSGHPLLVGLQRPDGVVRWTEVSGTALASGAGAGGILVRLRPHDGERHFDLSMAALVGDESLSVVFAHLARSAEATLEVPAAVIHHGFDRECFGHVDGADVAEACRSLEHGPWIDAARVGQRVCVELDALPTSVAGAARAAGYRACWSTPIPRRVGLAPAVLSVWSDAGASPQVGQRQALDRLVRYIQLALVRTAEHDHLRHRAGHDSLTGLANRATFHEAVSTAMASRADGVAVVYGDLDGFKAVNDRLGHLVGDALLAECARRLRARLRDGDVAGRVGGDEFTFLLHGVHDQRAVAAVTARLSGCLAEPFVIEGETVTMSLSMGVARVRHGEGPEALLGRADRALYTAKATGSGVAFDD